jgi:hypothetical protein
LRFGQKDSIITVLNNEGANMHQWKVTFTVYVEAENAELAEEQAIEFASEEDLTFVADINTEIV